jgi:phenylalanyl-tRNA synthetase beta chain
MMISLDWLNQYLDRAVDADEADRVLTDVGFPLEGREDVGDDVALDVEVTSNRSDVLSHIGTAREIAAATGRKLSPPTIDITETGEPADTLTSVANDAPELCPVYTARVIRGVKIAPSPAWLVQRLEAIGLRPVNNVVDVTNFVLHEMGQPLHAFDMNLLQGRKIVVRNASEGEPFTAIDGTKHKLTGDMLVIADAERPVAVAGVMGGLESEVGEATTDVLLESACFDPLSVRTTSRALKLASDSSYRFERGVDPCGIERASRRAAQLICELAGGKLARGVIRVGESEPEPKNVSMRPARCQQLLGYEMPAERMIALLDALELQPKIEGDAIACTVPSHRLDLEREVDLIEEVARLNGYGQIPVEPKMNIVARKSQIDVQARKLVGRTLIAHGFHETITFSNIAPKQAEPFLDDGHELITMDDDRRMAEPGLRPSLLPSLLAVRKNNQDAGNANVRLFEVAKVFSSKGGRYAESKDLALLSDASSEPTLRELRGTIEELCEAMDYPVRIEAAGRLTPKWAETAGLIMNDIDDRDRVVGVFGRASAATTKRFDLKTSVDLAWLDYAEMTRRYPQATVVGELPKFPGIERDLSIVVDESVLYADIKKAATGTEPALMEELAFVGVYRGKQVGKGRKSVTLRMSFRDPAKTLRHEEVDPQVERIVKALEASLSAELRAG